MSSTHTASLRPWRWARATSSASVSWNSRRLPSPVSPSRVGQPAHGAAPPCGLDRRPRVRGDRLEGLKPASCNRRLLARADTRSGTRAGPPRTRSAPRSPTGCRALLPAAARSGTRSRPPAHGYRPAGRRRRRRRPGARRPAVEAGRGCQRDAVQVDTDDGSVDARQRDGRLGAPRQHLVEIERLTERLDDACAPRVLARPGRPSRASSRERSSIRSPISSSPWVRRRSDDPPAHAPSSRRARLRQRVPLRRPGMRAQRCSCSSTAAYSRNDPGPSASLRPGSCRDAWPGWRAGPSG